MASRTTFVNGAATPTHPVAHWLFRRVAKAPCPPRYDDERVRRRYHEHDVESTRRFFARFRGALDLQGKSVLDVGCGRGAVCAEAARLGAARIVGTDLSIPPQVRRLLAEDPAAAEVELLETDGTLRELGTRRFDVVISKDSFEHYANPEQFAGTLAALLEPGGTLAVGFGPLWKSPTGGHIEYMTGLPWAHLLFPEPVLMAERRRFRPDEDARRFEEIRGGLNRMTLARFERIMGSSGLERVYYATNVSDNPIVRVMAAASALPGLEEFFTTNVYGLWRAAPRD
jgi:SAM-dependent methyltransferase